MTIDRNITSSAPADYGVAAYNAMKTLGTEEQATALCETWGKIKRVFRPLGIFECDPIIFSNSTQVCRVEWKLIDLKTSNILGTLVFGSEPCLGENVVPKFWIRLNEELSEDDVHKEIFLINGLQDPLFFYSLREVYKLNKYAIRYPR